MNQIVYEYAFYGGKLHGQKLTKEQMKTVWNGKLSEDLSELRAKGLCVHRAELDNQPEVDGYLGPMYDGCKGDVVHLRYETQEVYDRLSK